ncbi:hypothetical protein BASA81_010348 [Batrachochytrium salamandrivorans]|nr:hypothetical protein BASA81_010348 [Batrachochytrium salamandrivorans]
MFLPLSIQSGSKIFQVKALLDSGSDECLIDEDIVNTYQLPLNLLKTPIALFLADGQPASKSHVTHETQLVKVTCQDHIEITKFYVQQHQVSRYLGSSIGCDAITQELIGNDLTIVFRSEYCQDNCTATQPVTCHSVEMTTCSTSRTDPDKLTVTSLPIYRG